MTAVRSFRGCRVRPCAFFAVSALAFVLLPAAAQAQGKKTLAVMEFGAGRATGVTLEERRALTDAVRTHANRNLSTSQWDVLTRDNLEQRLPPGMSLADCDEECVVTTGRRLQVDYLMTGSVASIGASLQVTIYAYNVASGALEASDVFRGRTVDDLLDPLDQRSAALFQKLGGGTGPAAFLSVVTEPEGARVMLDGRDLGVTPLTRARVQPGVSALEIQHNCYQTHAQRLELSVNQDRTVTQALKPREAWLVLTARDAVTGKRVKARVSAGGRQIGETPFQGKVNVCLSEVSLSAARYGDKTQAVTLSESVPFRAHVTLQPGAAAPPPPPRPVVGAFMALGITAALPAGNMGDLYKPGMGADLMLGFRFGRTLGLRLYGLTGASGYLVDKQSPYASSGEMIEIPVLGGAGLFWGPLSVFTESGANYFNEPYGEGQTRWNMGIGWGYGAMVSLGNLGLYGRTRVQNAGYPDDTRLYDFGLRWYLGS